MQVMPHEALHRKATTRPSRKRCQTCNNLSPRDHHSSVYDTESATKVQARLSLVLDAFALSRSAVPKDGGCRFCYVLCQALDAFFEDWRGTRQRINVDIKEKGTITVGLDQEKWKGELVKIYATKCKFAYSGIHPYMLTINRHS